MKHAINYSHNEDCTKGYWQENVYGLTTVANFIEFAFLNVPANLNGLGRKG